MKRAVVVVKQGRSEPIHVILPRGSKVLRISNMQEEEIDKAEEHGDQFMVLRLP